MFGTSFPNELLQFNNHLLTLVAKSQSPFLFVGAGISIDSQLPSWSKFIQRCVQKSFGDEISIDELADIHNVEKYSVWLIEYSLQNLKKKNPSFDQNKFFQECLWKDPELINPATNHYLLVKYAKEFNVPIFTTNYDDLLEVAASDLGLKPKIYDSVSSFKNFKKHFCIVYIHGRISGKKKVSSNDSATPVTGFFSYYDEFNRNDNKALTAFMSFLKTRTCLFVGTSMQDHNINRVLYLLKDENFKNPHYWFCEDKNKNIYNKNLHLEFWNLLNIRPIHCPSGNFSEITSTFRRILNHHNFKVLKAQNEKGKKTLYDFLNKAFQELMKNPISIYKCVGSFDDFEIDFYLDTSNTASEIKMNRIWASKSKTVLDFKKRKPRSFRIPRDIDTENFNEFVNKVPFSVETAVDSLKPHIGTRIDGFDYIDGSGRSDFNSWAYICFPIFSPALERAIGVWVLKYINKNNKLTSLMGKDDVLNDSLSRDIIALGQVVKVIYEEELGLK